MYEDELDQEYRTLEEEEKYNSLGQVSKVEHRSQKAGEKNQNKNRYANILPYDHSRILLKYGKQQRLEAQKMKDEKGQFKIDSTALLPAYHSGDDTYINANTIGRWGTQNRGRSYIATQGPLDPEDQNRGKRSTITDFWRLVVTSQSRIIVMIANCLENGQRKVGKYWPDKGKTMDIKHGRKDELILKIENINEEDKNFYVKRTLKVTAFLMDQLSAEYGYRGNKETQDKSMSWEVYQYHYTKWVDHGVAQSPEFVVEFLTDIHREHEQLNIPSSLKGPGGPSSIAHFLTRGAIFTGGGIFTSGGILHVGDFTG